MGMIDTLDALYRETTPGEWETRFYRDGKTIAVPSGYLIPNENCLSSADLCFIVEMRRNWPEIRDRLRAALLPEEARVEAFEDAAQKCRYYLKHQNFGVEEDPYEQGVTVACENLEKIMLEEAEKSRVPQERS